MIHLVLRFGSKILAWALILIHWTGTFGDLKKFYCLFNTDFIKGQAWVTSFVSPLPKKKVIFDNLASFDTFDLLKILFFACLHNSNFVWFLSASLTSSLFLLNFFLRLLNVELLRFCPLPTLFFLYVYFITMCTLQVYNSLTLTSDNVYITRSGHHCLPLDRDQKGINSLARNLIHYL